MQQSAPIRSSHFTTSDRHVAIVMGVQDGAATLPEQLQSFVAQDHDDWSLVVSDDGSSDASQDVVRRFAQAQEHREISLIDGPRLGFAMNFITTLARLPGPPAFAALSDQDDVWLPERLSRGVGLLSLQPEDIPALYLGRTMICDARMRPLRPSPHFMRPPSFGNALVQCIGGGNTMMLNRAAVDLVQRLAPQLHGIFAHDWWLYQLITGVGGNVIYDDRPMVHYRQHNANLIGANDTAGAIMARAMRLFGGQFRTWMDANLQALEAVSDVMTDENRKTIAGYAKARRGGPVTRLLGVHRAGIHRQRRRETAALYVSALLRKL